MKKAKGYPILLFSILTLNLIAIDEIKEKEESSNILFFERYSNKEMKNTIGMWQIESPNYHQGGPIKWDTKLKFRNLT